MSAKDYSVPEPGYKDYERPFPVIWWTKSRSYFVFMIREVTSLFVLLFAMRLVQGLIALSKGEVAWNKWVAAASDSTSLAICSVLALLFVLFHSLTWFRAGAIVTPLRIGNFQMPVPLFVAGNMGLVVVVAVVIGYFSMGG